MELITFPWNGCIILKLPKEIINQTIAAAMTAGKDESIVITQIDRDLFFRNWWWITLLVEQSITNRSTVMN